LAPSWKPSKRRHRSIGVSPLKPPLLGDFLSSFVHTVFEGFAQSIALANTSSYARSAPHWTDHETGPKLSRLPWIRRRVLREPETLCSFVSVQTGPVCGMSLAALGIKWRSLPRDRGSRLSHQMPQAPYPQ
jgi:hypothetical protein